MFFMRNNILLLLVAMMLLALTLTVSCKDTDDASDINMISVNGFMKEIRQNACNLYHVPCFKEKSLLTRSVDDYHDFNVVYVSDPNLSIINDEQGCDSVKQIITSSHTLNQLIENTKVFGLQVSVSDSANAICNVYINEDSARVALDPMVEESRSYLYAKGFSENEIQELLNETDTDESLLVPLVLELMSVEQSRTETFNTGTKKSWTLMDIFATRAYAQINWVKVGGCASAVLVGELKEELLNKTITKSTLKVVLKTALRKIASRLLGPVGVVLVIAEFSFCMWS